MVKQKKFPDMQGYIESFPADLQQILQNIREALNAVLPEAEEQIRYNMPAMDDGGCHVYFAAFKKHIGIFPPVKGDAALQAELLRYRGEKGNLKFPLNEPMPYGLIQEVAKGIVKEYRERGRSI